MAFPFAAEVNFEGGTRGSFDSETDTTGRLDFAHYSDLAAVPGLPGPFSGAFCMRVDLAPSITDAFVTETDSWDIAASGNLHIAFKLFVTSNIVMANLEQFVVWRVLDGASAVMAVCSVNFTDADGLRLGIGKIGATSFLPLTTNVWHTVELELTLDDGGSNDGTIDLRLDGAAATQVASLDQNATVSGQLGVLDQDAGTTAGVVLFDEVITDDARIFPTTFRYPVTKLLTTSGHAFVGAGRVESVSLLSGGATDNVLSVFDTDRGNTDDASKIVAELNNTANDQLVRHFGDDIQVQRGCFISMSGTNPRALVKIKYAPAYGSDGAIRTAGASWKPTPGNV